MNRYENKSNDDFEFTQYEHKIDDLQAVCLMEFVLVLTQYEWHEPLIYYRKT